MKKTKRFIILGIIILIVAYALFYLVVMRNERSGGRIYCEYTFPLPTCFSMQSDDGVRHGGETPCELLTDESTCVARNDCLAVDLCGCTTDDDRTAKCGDTSIKCLCVLGGFSYCQTLSCQIQNPDDNKYYYDVLYAACSSDCCRSSATEMRNNKWRLASSTGCRYSTPDQLKCVGSYQWCDTSQSM